MPGIAGPGPDAAWSCRPACSAAGVPGPVRRRGRGARRVHLGHRLPALAEPLLHARDLVLLRRADAAASVRTDGLAPWVSAMRAIVRAWAWWPIMADMKRTSAAV
jgi:hypothetical protein